MAASEYEEGSNRGPGGAGPYRNDNNKVANSGETEPTEPTSLTGELMAAMPTQVATGRGSERPATDKELRGGN